MAYKLPPDHLDRDLVLNFFWKFSVFECALKSEGFLKSGRWAAADWDRFGSEVKGCLARVSVPGFAGAVRKLVDYSPRRQVVREDGCLGWETTSRTASESDEEHVLRLLRTARNNLFHGGKYPDGPVDEVTRDRAILRTCLTVLDGCFELHEGVKKLIDEAA